MKTITFSYNEFGYEVLVWSDGRCIHEYHAGNHKLDSSQRTCDPRWMVPIEELRQYAAQTAREIAVEYGVPVDRIGDNGLMREG